MVSARMCRVHICIYGHVLLFPGRGYAHGHHNTCYLWGFGGMRRMMMMIGIWTPIRDTGKQWHLAVYFLYLLVIPVFLQSNELLYRLYGLYWIYRKKIDRLYSIYYYYCIYSTSRCISKPCHSAVRHLKCRRLGCVRWIDHQPCRPPSWQRRCWTSTPERWNPTWPQHQRVGAPA